MSSNSLVLGIDFGTTNTSAAWCDTEGKIHLVPTGTKSYVLPSVVWFGANGKVLVGHPARQQIIDDPHHTVYGIKRFIGRRYASEYVSRHKDRFIYSIVEDENGLASVSIDTEIRPLTDVAFEIIQRTVELANAAAGVEFEECVLTVPAHYSFAQRKAVRVSAEMLGLEVRAVVNEPTAAALYYAKHKDISQTVLIFDLGGGTFDATLLSVDRRKVEVLGTGGEAFLGGMDFDSAVVESLCERFEMENGVDLRSNKVVMQRLLFAAETAKIALTKESSTRLRVPFVAQGPSGFLDLDHTMSREELETITERLIAKTMGITEETIESAGIPPDALGEIVFVGGQTRMPAIQKRLSSRFRHDPKKNLHPDLGVAIGAAILGRTLNLPRGPALLDVIPIPIGIMLPGAGSIEVIERNTPVPATERTAIENRPPPGQPLVLAVYEALDPTSVERELLGTIRVDPDWLDSRPGRLEIEMRVGQDFDLTIALLSESGDSMRLEMVPPRKS